MPEKKWKVVFYSPGTFFDETQEEFIDPPAIAEAVRKAKKITERHGAKPYAFSFKLMLVADPIPDGFGGTMNVEPKMIEQGGLHFIDGKLLTIDQILARRDTKDATMISNMTGNNYPIVCETRNSYKHVGVFGESDFVVSSNRELLERGDDPVHVAYRKSKKK